MQLTTQSIAVAPSRPSVVIPEAAYVYDIAHRNGQCVGTLKIMDIGGVLLVDAPSCPVGTGACVTSVAGGELAGFDMYGQPIKETLAAASVSDYAYVMFTQAPADAAWQNVFGLPYKWESGGGSEGTYTPPAADGDPRGLIAPSAGSLTAGEVTLNYMVDQSDTFGNMMDRLASDERIDDVTMVGTVSAGGEIIITQGAVPDGSSWAKFTFPADAGGPVVAANAGSTITYQLSDLWMSKYTRNQQTDAWVDGLVRGVTENGTNIIVDLVGNPEPANPNPPAPPPDDVFGPYSMSDGGEFYVRSSDCMIGLQTDADPEPDVWITQQHANDDDALSADSKNAMDTQLKAHGCAGLPDAPFA